MNIISLKNSEVQPNFHFIYLGPSKIPTHIRFKIKHRILNKKIILNKKHTNKLLDFIIDEKYNIALGHYHLYLSNNKDYVYGAGRVMINESGFISYLDNHSGHYRPSYEEFSKIKQYFISNFQCYLNYDKCPESLVTMMDIVEI